MADSEPLNGDPAGSRDHRLYVPDSDHWAVRLKVTWDKEYCFAKSPGQDYLHLLVHGEIFLQRGDERLCLTCAFRKGYLTSDRLFWQNQPRVTSIPVVGLGG